MGSAHARTLAASARAELVVCHDVDATRARATPPGARFTTDFDDALAGSGLDAVVVATPEPAHREVAVAALEQGLHVLCEKPLAASLADADAIVEAAVTTSRLLAVGHVSRFDPRYGAVRRAVDDGSLGPPLHVSASRLSHVGERERYGPRTTLALELAVHDLDLFRWLAGEIESVYALGSSRDGELEDSLVATVRFRSGAVGALECSWALAEAGLEWEHRLTYVGESGFAHVDGRSRGVAIHTPGRSSTPDVLTLWDHDGVVGGILAAQDERFLRCVLEGLAWPLSPADARAAVAAALALDASLERGTLQQVDA